MAKYKEYTSDLFRKGWSTGSSVNYNSDSNSSYTQADVDEDNKRKKKKQDEVAQQVVNKKKADDALAELKKKSAEDAKKKDQGFKLPGQEIFEAVGNAVKDYVVAPTVKAVSDVPGATVDIFNAIKGPDKAKGINDRTLTKAEVDERRDVYKSHAGIDIDKAMADKQYLDAFADNATGSSKNRDKYKKLAEQLNKEGRITNLETKKKFEEAGKYPVGQSKSGLDLGAELYRQVVTESIDTPQSISDVENSFVRNRLANSDKQTAADKTIRNVTGGLVETFVDLPNNLGSVGSTLLAGATPDDWDLDKFAKQWQGNSAKNSEKVQKWMQEEGLAASEQDDFWTGGLPRGAGSLAAGLIIPGGKSTEVVGFLPNLFKFLRPGTVGAVFGVNKAGQVTRDAKENGVGDLQSAVTGIGAGYIEGILENFGMGQIKSRVGKAFLPSLVRTSLTEGTQEFLQDIASSGFEDTYKDVDWAKAVASAWESGKAGFILGGVAGGGAALSTSQEGKAQGAMEKELQAQGVDKAKAKELSQQYVTKIQEKMQAGEQINTKDDADSIIAELNSGVDPQQTANPQDGDAIVAELNGGQPSQTNIPVTDGDAIVQELNGGEPAPDGGAIIDELNQGVKLFSHVTKASNLDSILKGGLNPATPMQLDDNGNVTDKPLPGYEGQTAVYLNEGTKADYTHPDEDNINIVYEDSAIPNKVVNGTEVAVNENIPVTPENVKYIEVPNKEMADKLIALGFDARVNLDFAKGKKTETKPVVTKPARSSNELTHYTSKENALEINKNGFVIKKTKSSQGDGVYFLNKPEYGKFLSDDMKQGNEQITVTLEPGTKILDLTSPDYDGPSPTSGNKLKKYALKNGYDGASDSTQTVIYNTDKIIVKKVSEVIKAESATKGKPKSLNQKSEQQETAPTKGGVKPLGKPKIKTESTVGTSKLAERVRKDAIKKKMIYGFDKTFNDLPDYDKVNRKQQFEKATELVLNDLHTATEIAMGRQSAPDGLLNNSVWMAVKEYAENTKNINLMRELAHSDLVTRATGMGQEIAMLAEKNPFSPIELARQIRKERVKTAERRSKTTVEKEAKTVEKVVKKSKAKITKETWNDFIKGLEC